MGWSLIAYSFGEYFSKRWALAPSIGMTCCVVLAYATAQIGWLPALRMHGQLSVLTVIWSLAAIICGILIGVCGFGEELTTRQTTGIILAIISMLLMF